MEDEVVYLKNVVFELYKAALNGEITQSEFFKAKRIVKRAKALSAKEGTSERRTDKSCAPKKV